MAMKAMMAALTAASAAAPHRALLPLFSTTSTLSSSFPFPQTMQHTPAREHAEPNTILFVSGLSKTTTTEGLEEAFSKFGEVVHARVVTDRVSGYFKGYGFVRYATLSRCCRRNKGHGWTVEF